MTGIQRLLPVFVEAKGYYLLPAVAAALVALRYACVRRGLERPQRFLFGALVATAAFSILVYVNFFNFHYRGFVNAYEFFHYYLGSKYAKEIGYFDIYNAALVADYESGLQYGAPDGRISDLTTYGYRSVRDVLAESDLYKSRFTPERWQQWVKDVSYFKKRLRGRAWNDVLRDKGYNATPVWSTIVGGALSGRISTDDGAGMTLLALLDVALLIAAVGCVGWTFGKWPALLMVVLLASSYMMAHVHMKGAFLRTDFVVALVGAMCLLARRRHAAAGVLVAYSTLARVFPVLFLFGPGVKLATELVPVGREASRRIRDRHGPGARSFLVVAAFLLVHLLAAAAIVSGGWAAIGNGAREVLTANLGAPRPLFSSALALVTLLLLAATLAAWGTHRKLLEPRHVRFFGAFAITGAVLVGLSVVHAGGVGEWASFARKMALHRTTYNHWNIGLTSVVIAEFDPPGPRAEALAIRPASSRNWLGNVFFRSESVAERAWPIRLLQLAAIVGAWLAARRFGDALAFAYGFVLTFFLTAPTYYYYVVLLVPFLFFAAHPDRLRGAIGQVYIFLFGALGFAFYFRWDQYFTTYWWNSVLALVLALGMLAAAFGTGAWPDAAVLAVAPPTVPPSRSGRSRRR